MANFLGFEDSEKKVYGKTRIVVLPVAYEGTASYGKGTSLGPKAIINASEQLETYDDELGYAPFTAGIWTEGILTAEDTPEKMVAEVYKHAKKHVDAGKFLVMLGGEHSLTAGAVKACREKYENLSVLQFDAHADLRKEYDGTRHSHAAVMSRVRELCPAVQVGIRDFSKPEAEKIKKNKYPVFLARDIYDNDAWMSEAVEKLSNDVYITFDIDAFDPSLIPSTGTPQPGGLQWYQVMKFLRKIFEKKNVVGCDIMELSPIPHLHGPDFIAAKLTYKMIGYKFATQK